MPYKNPEDRRKKDRERRQKKKLIEAQKFVAAQEPRKRSRVNPTKKLMDAAQKRSELGKRLCLADGCSTVLSRYNPEQYCATHAPFYVKTTLSDFL